MAGPGCRQKRHGELAAGRCQSYRRAAARGAVRVGQRPGPPLNGGRQRVDSESAGRRSASTTAAASPNESDRGIFFRPVLVVVGSNTVDRLICLSHQILSIVWSTCPMVGLRKPQGEISVIYIVLHLFRLSYYDHEQRLFK